MHLLVIILDKAVNLERILEKWKELGITGATIFDSIGVGRSTLYGTDAPIIANLKRIFEPEHSTYNHTLVSVIKSDETLEEAMNAANEICGDFTKPDVGVMFSIKLDRVYGLRLDDEPSSD
ncbi:MAG TPA: hypothetical protein ENN67_06170 [Firmicutes bacterium]|nr:hypothetical protein [Bacillota bacterium]